MAADVEDCMSLTLLYPPSCRWFVNGKRCGATPTRPFKEGARCRDHTPWVLAGQPEPIPPNEAARRKERK